MSVPSLLSILQTLVATPSVSCTSRALERAGAVAFGTEAPFLERLGTETVVLGPGKIEQAHRPDEYLELDSIQPTIEILERLIRLSCLEK